ncbi:phage DNA ejection protein [Salmonella enterica subsp. enterica serovar Typhimurium]|uniref:DNA transfer protein p33 n=1 Tax=Salmonella enterica TaxID=28901 RepID=A0A754AEQ4_SALER|nr:phage DNA ejection protein [Salmonella enterica]AUV44748.1 DNA transfer protein p33 [Citrobacter freundii complex sp. CFNIH9]EBX0144495.1 DNA transfer protein p33 [Salmonella enterica subsp. enterica serovar Typhimurium]ECG0821198.1 DNA transfer protein p33 [Salmonella enterica subsp. enterica]EHG3825737.1 DNA transfer protein p33 [Salmonella enterica subsp. enterica serovar 4,[5],12:i:-]MBA7978319.1 phage DNA ejection protein [Citrobacter freundii]
MATWQPGGLQSLAPQNTNAPNSGVPQPMQYQQQPNVGLMALQGIGGVIDANKQYNSAQQLKDYQAQLGSAVANNDRAGVQQLMAQYPQFMADSQKQMGFIDAEQNRQTADAAMNLRLASQTGDPMVMQKAIMQANPVLQRFGLPAEEVYQSWQRDPQGFNRTTDLIHLHADPNSYFAVQDKQQGQGIAQQNANTSAYNARVNASQGDRRLDLDQYKAQTDNQLRTREMALQARLGRARNDIEREKLTAELGTVQQAKMEKQNDKINTVAGNIDSLNSALGVGHELAGIVGQHPTAVSRNQGGTVGWLPNWADDTRSLNAKAEEYNLKVILPSLKGTFGGNPTEGERAALMQSQNGIKSATSNDAFLRELNKAQNTIVRMQKRQIAGLGIPVTKSQDEDTDTKMLLQDPSLVKDYVTAHGYLPESYYQAKLKGGQ